MNTLQKWIGILLVLGIGVGLYYYFVNKNTDVRSDEETATTTDNVVATPDNGWKTYSNDQYGFSFQYPSEASVTQSRKDYQPGDIFSWNAGEEGAGVRWLTIEEFKNWGGETRYAQLLDLNENFLDYKPPVFTYGVSNGSEAASTLYFLETKTLVGGLPALDVMRHGGGDVGTRRVYVLKGEHVVEIATTGEYLKSNCDAYTCEVVYPVERIDETTDFDRFLSTFKFI